MRNENEVPQEEEGQVAEQQGGSENAEQAEGDKGGSEAVSDNS